MNNKTLPPVQLPSILDNDLYKFTMQQAACLLYPDRRARYRFIDRADTIYTPEVLERLRASVDAMAGLKLKARESAFMKHTGLFKEPYLDFLADFRYDPKQVRMELNTEGRLEMTVDGLWKDTILWEVPLMALLSEIALEAKAPMKQAAMTEFAQRAVKKARQTRQNALTLAEFGTRRRRNFAAQEIAVKALAEEGGETFLGTSNVHLAMKYGVKPIGTMAHEWIMAHAAIFGVRAANAKALQSWKKIYPQKLKVFLPDTYGSALAFDTLRKEDFAYLDGFRWDSGKAEDFTEELLRRYAEHGINAQEKTIVYSDGLDINTAVELKKATQGRIKAAFGIGTTLTNDFAEKPLRIVIKLDMLDNKPVAKISDTPEKASGAPEAIAEAFAALDAHNQMMHGHFA